MAPLGVNGSDGGKGVQRFSREGAVVKLTVKIIVAANGVGSEVFVILL